jgi:hypothetical protein
MNAVISSLLSFMFMLTPTSVIVKNYNAVIEKGGWIPLDVPNFSVVLKSQADLDAYVDAIVAEFRADTAIVPEGFWEEQEGLVRQSYARFDKKFFKKNDLVIALVDRGSGACRYSVTGVTLEAGELTINVGRDCPMVMTMDYVPFVLKMEIPKDYNAKNANIVLTI